MPQNCGLQNGKFFVPIDNWSLPGQFVKFSGSLFTLIQRWEPSATHFCRRL